MPIVPELLRVRLRAATNPAHLTQKRETLNFSLSNQVAVDYVLAVENDIFPFNRGTDFEYDSVETLDSIECEVIESVFRANAQGVIMSVLSCFLHVENSIDISSVKIHLGKGMS